MGDIEVFRYLVEAGADLNMPPQSGWGASALSAAAFSGHAEIIKYLVQEAGVDVNVPPVDLECESAFAVAKSSGCTEVVDFLVQKGGANTNMSQ